MFEQGISVSATQIKALKKRVNTEMKRRKYTGPVTKYAASTWAYTTAPAAGVEVLIEHANKIITPLNAINSTGYTIIAEGDQIDSFKDLEAKLVKFEARSVTLNSTDCKSSCTGMCYTACSGACRTGCTGCSGSCSGDCKGGCKYGCSGDCKGGCNDNCAYGCTSTCTGNCYQNCTGCGGNCSGSCKSSSSGCGGCSYGCSGSSV